MNQGKGENGGEESGRVSPGGGRGARAGAIPHDHRGGGGNGAGGQNDARLVPELATGNKLKIEQAHFLACEHCGNLKCYSSKVSCIKVRVEHEKNIQHLQLSINGKTKSEASGRKRLVNLKDCTPSASSRK